MASYVVLYSLGAFCFIASICFTVSSSVLLDESWNDDVTYIVLLIIGIGFLVAGICLMAWARHLRWRQYVNAVANPAVIRVQYQQPPPGAVYSINTTGYPGPPPASYGMNDYRNVYTYGQSQPGSVAPPPAYAELKPTQS